MIRNPPDPNWHIEKKAKPSKSHPYGGFWKVDVRDTHGIAIGKAKDGLYFVSFCGPGGCFEEGTYRKNTTLVDDEEYRVIDKDTIEILGKDGFTRYFRSKRRENA